MSATKLGRVAGGVKRAAVGEPSYGNPRKPLCFAADRLVIRGLGPRSFFPPRMRRTLALTLLTALLCPALLEGQAVDESLVPRGRLRLEATTSFTSWDARFGRRDEGGSLVEEKEDLGSDLTDPIGTSLFPTIRTLEEQIRAMTADPSYSSVLGSIQGRVAHDVTRIDFGAHLGVFDWLTLGVVIPWMKTRTSLATAVRVDSASADLGLNPTVTDADAVISFLDGAEAAASAAMDRAAGLCGADPGSADCSSAQTLADRAGSFRTAARTAYFSSPFFPRGGTTTAGALQAAASALDGDLSAAGLPGLGAPMAFATEFLTDASFLSLPARGATGIQGASLAPIDGIWAVGDVELSASFRILDGELRDSAAPAPRLRYTLGGALLARMGTGQVDDTDVFLDVGTGDGQMDFEARAFGALDWGRRLGLRGGVRYGVQGSTSLLRRVAPPEIVMPSAATRRAVRWSPASYVALELAPHFRFSRELALDFHYRVYSKGADSYEILGEEVEGSIPVDITDLERESGVTLHQTGIGLTYSTLEAWRAGEAPKPLELRLRLLSASSGSGGQVPVTTRVEFGIRLFRGIWGGS
jgi:hypothetical protein